MVPPLLLIDALLTNLLRAQEKPKSFFQIDKTKGTCHLLQDLQNLFCFERLENDPLNAKSAGLLF